MRYPPLRLAVVALALSAVVLGGHPDGALAQGRAAREVAVTFDDLPVHTRLHAADVAEQERVTERLLDAIRRHRVPAIGFVNEGKLLTEGRLDPRRVELLRAWARAGLELGNHSYSHFDLHRTALATYEEDIARGDAVTRRVLAEAGRDPPRWFRHPFLHTGRDPETRTHVERFLAARGYRVAPVTMDNNEYVFAVAYERVLARGDSAGAQAIGEEYLAYMTRVVAYYERQSVALLGREVRQVLLLHANRLNADRFDALARMLAGRGYRFVSIERAVADPAYELRDGYTGPSGITWIHRWALSQGKHGAFFAGEPTVPESVERAAMGREGAPGRGR